VVNIYTLEIKAVKPKNDLNGAKIKAVKTKNELTGT